jgi:hypothetical protein
VEVDANGHIVQFERSLAVPDRFEQQFVFVGRFVVQPNATSFVRYFLDGFEWYAIGRKQIPFVQPENDFRLIHDPDV